MYCESTHKVWWSVHFGPIDMTSELPILTMCTSRMAHVSRS